MPEAMGGCLTNDRLAVAVKIEQRIPLGGYRRAIERLQPLLAGSVADEILIFEFEDGSRFFVGVERLEPLADIADALLELVKSHAVRLGESHAVGVAESPIQPFVDQAGVR